MITRDFGGISCCFLVYGCLIYSDFALIAHILVPFVSRTFAVIVGVIFNLGVGLIVISHAKAALTDPGHVPLPDARIDFSDRDSLQEREDNWTICQRCEMWRPPRAHHCRICGRCVRKMDHHCPWVNNCVGEWNQKYFILFLLYTFICSIIACAIIAIYWNTVWEVDNINHTPHVVSLLIESSLFALFTSMILYDQVTAIIDDETAVEARKRETGKLKRVNRKRQVSTLSKMREVFGPGSYWLWLIPCSRRKGTSPILTPLLSYSV
jgi:ribosomal protein L40E